MGEVPTDTFGKTTLFEKSSDLTYRIPSLVYLQQRKRYLAFAEKRTSSSDHDAKCLVIRRTITDGSVQWSDCEELSTAKLEGYRSMNPCPVYDSNTQTLFLFFTCVFGNVTEKYQIKSGINQTRLCIVTSKDHGDTWSEAKDLTESVIGVETLGRWATFGVGPGHGIQLMAGRLVVPAYTYYVPLKFFGLFPVPLTVQQRALSIYSDDAGDTWRIGKLLGAESGECEMAEVIERGVSYLYCNARRKGTRVEALSHDSGEHFEEPYGAPSLVEPGDGCQGSVISFPAPEPSESVPTWLAFSHPTDERERLDLGVYLNRTPMSKSTWDPPVVIHRGPSGYSDLAYNQDDHSFSCLLECGQHSELEQIALTSFKLADIRPASD